MLLATRTLICSVIDGRVNVNLSTLGPNHHRTAAVHAKLADHYVRSAVSVPQSRLFRSLASSMLLLDTCIFGRDDLEFALKVYGGKAYGGRHRQPFSILVKVIASISNEMTKIDLT